MNELQIIVNQQQGVISTNFEDVKSALVAQMEVYKELEVNLKNKSERKDDIATLRKMIKAGEDERKKVKRKCLEPYDEFEKAFSELIVLINEPIKLIDDQVKELEDRQRLEKVVEIDKIFDELVGDLSDNVSLDRIRDSKWENVATSLKSIREDITVKLSTIRGDLTAIRGFMSDKTEEAVNRYFDNFDLSSAISFINRYEQQKKEIEQRMIEQQRIDKEAEEERQRLSRERELEQAKENAIKEARAEVAKEEQAKAEIARIKFDAEQKAREEEETKTRAKEKAEQEALSAKKQSSTTVNYIYGISATDEEFDQIEMYLNSLGVEFERIG